MICPNCHADVRDDAKFCPRCGTKLMVLPQESSIDREPEDEITEIRPIQPIQPLKKRIPDPIESEAAVEEEPEPEMPEEDPPEEVSVPEPFDWVNETEHTDESMITQSVSKKRCRGVILVGVATLLILLAAVFIILKGCFGNSDSSEPDDSSEAAEEMRNLEEEAVALRIGDYGDVLPGERQQMENLLQRIQTGIQEEDPAAVETLINRFCAMDQVLGHGGDSSIQVVSSEWDDTGRVTLQVTVDTQGSAIQKDGFSVWEKAAGSTVNNEAAPLEVQEQVPSDSESAAVCKIVYTSTCIPENLPEAGLFINYLGESIYARTRTAYTQEDEQSKEEKPEEKPEEEVKDNSESESKEEPEEEPKDSAAVLDSEYILPDSASRYLTADEVSGLSKEMLRLARNEIYARKGRRFQDAELQSYFDSKSWYKGTIAPESFTDGMLNEYEKANITLIQQYE